MEMDKIIEKCLNIRHGFATGDMYTNFLKNLESFCFNKISTFLCGNFTIWELESYYSAIIVIYSIKKDKIEIIDCFYDIFMSSFDIKKFKFYNVSLKRPRLDIDFLSREVKNEEPQIKSKFIVIIDEDCHKFHHCKIKRFSLRDCQFRKVFIPN